MIVNSNNTIKSFGGYLTKSEGIAVIELEINHSKLKRVFEVVEYKRLTLLSYEACKNMQYKLPEIN